MKLLNTKNFLQNRSECPQRKPILYFMDVVGHQKTTILRKYTLIPFRISHQNLRNSEKLFDLILGGIGRFEIYRAMLHGDSPWGIGLCGPPTKKAILSSLYSILLPIIGLLQCKKAVL